MYAQCKKSKFFATAIVLAGLLLWAFGVPGSLYNRIGAVAVPNYEFGAEYAAGWNHGCQTGTNSYAPLSVFLLKPLVIKNPDLSKNDLYKQGWNEGFTVCRFTQDAWFNILALLLIVLTIAGITCRSTKTE
jgi:hypothetical protein